LPRGRQPSTVSATYDCHVPRVVSLVPNDGPNPPVPCGVQSDRRRSRGGHRGAAVSVSWPPQRNRRMRRQRHGAEGRDEAPKDWLT
jgi:hypothetical protein